MTPQGDESYREEIAEGNGVRWLSRLLFMLNLASAVLIALQVGVVFWLAGQCIPIVGLTLSGRLFHTDSLTCPDPNVKPLWPHHR